MRELMEFQRVKSLDDLLSEKARSIADKYDLDVREILPRYLELTEEVRANDGQIEIDADNPATPINVHGGYIRKIACGAVISYELATREALNFPVVEESSVIAIGQEAFLMAVKLRGNIRRNAPVQYYEQIGQYYEQVIDILERHQATSVDRMLENR